MGGCQHTNYELKIITGSVLEVETKVTEWFRSLEKRIVFKNNTNPMFEISSPQIFGAKVRVICWAL